MTSAEAVRQGRIQDRGLAMRRRMVVLALISVGCSKPEPGTDRGPCLGNGTCNGSLVCASGACVSPTGGEAPAAGQAKEKSSSGRNATKAKTIEATVNLKKLYEGARSYYQEEQVARGSIEPLPKQFPGPHAGPSPPLGACCKSPGHKCEANPSLWSLDPIWEALKFSMDDPHFYSYEFIATGTGTGSQFTARAYGDLDCNGVYSTFEVTGKVGADGNVSNPAGITEKNGLE